MNKKKAHAQAGFAVLEVVLIVVVLAVAGFVCYFVYNANNQATDTYDAADESSTTQPIKKKTTNDAKADAAKETETGADAATGSTEPTQVEGTDANASSSSTINTDNDAAN